MDMQELRKLRTSNFALIVKTKGLSQIVDHRTSKKPNFRLRSRQKNHWGKTSQKA